LGVPTASRRECRPPVSHPRCGSRTSQSIFRGKVIDDALSVAPPTRLAAGIARFTFHEQAFVRDDGRARTDPSFSDSATRLPARLEAAADRRGRFKPPPRLFRPPAKWFVRKNLAGPRPARKSRPAATRTLQGGFAANEPSLFAFSADGRHFAPDLVSISREKGAEYDGGSERFREGSCVPPRNLRKQNRVGRRRISRTFTPSKQNSSASSLSTSDNRRHVHHPHESGSDQIPDRKRKLLLVTWLTQKSQVRLGPVEINREFLCVNQVRGAVPFPVWNLIEPESCG